MRPLFRLPPLLKKASKVLQRGRVLAFYRIAPCLSGNYSSLHKYGRRTRDFRAFVFLFCFNFFSYFGGVFNTTFIPLPLAGYEMIIANLALRVLLAITSYSTIASRIISK